MKVPWLAVRLVLMVLGFLSALCIGLTHQVRGDALDVPPPLTMAFVLPIVVPVCVIAIVGVLSRSPITATHWTAPTHRVNPFTLRDPPRFFHFMGHFAGASSLGSLAASGGHVPWLLFRGIAGMLGALGFIIGVELCRRLFKHKYETHAGRADADGT